MNYQKRLPFSRKRTPITCGHPEKDHYANGMCAACYARDYRAKNLPARRLAEAKSAAKRAQKERPDGIRRAIKTRRKGG